jgi:hypothetical protein
VRVTVFDSAGKRASGARVRLTGPGVRASAKRTNKLGQVTFKVRPKKRGKLLFTATKPGFLAAYASLKVR